MKQIDKFRKNFIWNTLGTGLNAFNSLFFMIIATRINGVEEAGIFAIAFSTACIVYTIGIYAGRIYQVTELNKSISNKDFILNRLITSIIMIMSLLIFCMIRNYDIEKTLIFFLLTIYKALEAFSDIFYGILQKNEELDLVGKSLALKSILSIIVFLILNIIFKNIIISIIGMIIICVLIIIFYDFLKTNKYLNYKEKANKKNIIYIFKKGFFTFAITFLGMYVLNAPKYAIDMYLSNDFQTIFAIIVMPATVVGLVAQFLIHPFLTKILDLYKKLNLRELKNLILKLFYLISAFGIIATIFAYLFGTQILGIIYGIELSEYKIWLSIIIISATLYTVVTIYSSILTTVRETMSQFIIYIAISIIALLLSNLFTKIWQIKGAVIAYFLIMACAAVIYTIYTNIKIKIIFKSKEQLLYEKSNNCSTNI